MYLAWQDRWKENTEVCYRGHCFIDLPPQSAAAALNKNLLLKSKDGLEREKKRPGWEVAGGGCVCECVCVWLDVGSGRWRGNLLIDIKWEFQPGCLRGEVTKRGCVKVRRVHSERECQVKLIKEPWPFHCIFAYGSPQAPWAASRERWETVMF